MIDYISKLMQEIGFPTDAQDYYINLYNSLDESDFEFLNKMQSEYYLEQSDDMLSVNKYVNEALKSHAAQRHFEEYGFYMIFLLYCSQRLEKNYIQKGYKRELFIDIMKDLTFKNKECRDVYNAWGTFVFPWFHRHYLCKLFSLGRFQYETVKFEGMYKKCGVNLMPSDTVYNLHIPSSGPVDEKTRIESYKKAFGFYGFNSGDKMPIVCYSWILYPENKHIFNKKSNIYSFFNDFDIINSDVSEENNFPDAWRVFNMDFTGDTSILPHNSSLQRNIASWLESGRKIGNGYGVIIFDGENIVNNTGRI